MRVQPRGDRAGSERCTLRRPQPRTHETHRLPVAVDGQDLGPAGRQVLIPTDRDRHREVHGREGIGQPLVGPEPVDLDDPGLRLRVRISTTPVLAAGPLLRAGAAYCHQQGRGREGGIRDGAQAHGEVLSKPMAPQPQSTNIGQPNRHESASATVHAPFMNAQYCGHETISRQCDFQSHHARRPIFVPTRMRLRSLRAEFFMTSRPSGDGPRTQRTGPWGPVRPDRAPELRVNTLCPATISTHRSAGVGLQ